jgi:thiol-disulfide isomerase/thioredoxin
MNYRQIAIRLGIVCTAVLIASCAPDGSSDSAALVGKPAADFSLSSVENRPVKLSDFRGSVVVVDFWATWCPPCRESLPNLNRLSTDTSLAARGLKVLAVNSQESPGDVKSFLASNRYSFPVLLDSDGSAERAYEVTGLPTTLVVGRDGSVKYAVSGYGGDAGEAELNDAVQKALTEK